MQSKDTTGIHLEGHIKIHDPDFAEKFTPDVIKPIRCSMAICGCRSEVRIPKRKLNV